MSEPLNNAVLVVVPSELEASIIVAGLEDRGIRARASGVLASAFRAEAPGGVQVLVHAEDFEKAKAALAEIRGAAPADGD